MKQILIDFLGPKTRTVLLENGEPVEFAIDDPGEPQILGNIYVGIVKRVLPNGFVFIDIGQENCAFMDSKLKLSLKQGEHVVVQVVKSGHGDKAPNVSTELCFTGRYCVVYNSPDSEIGVSKKIENKAVRSRLKALASDLLPAGYGAIVRTEAADELAAFSAEINKLSELAKNTVDFGIYEKPPRLIHGKGYFLRGTLHALMDGSVTGVVVNKPEEIAPVAETLSELGYSRELLSLRDSEDIFTEFYVSQDFDKALKKRVWLRCGGYIVIERTEACVVIDVNTGKQTGKEGHFKTNSEAASEIARQLRLRNLSGIIIIDFIDMPIKYNQRLREILETEVKKDRLKVTVVGMTELGLMQLTRKRTGKTLEESWTWSRSKE